MKFRKIYFALAIIIAFAANPATARIDFDVELGAAPPPAYVEPVPAAPRPGYVWAGGYWGWQNNAYVWIPGRWIEERPGYVWYPEHWEQREGKWHLARGEWRHEERRR